MKNKSKLLLIGRGGEKEGLGHLIRLGSLVEEFYSFFDISFLTNQNKLESILLTKVIIPLYFFNDYRSLLRFFGGNKKYTLIIVDILNIPLSILKKIKKHCDFLFVFDDLKKYISWDRSVIIIHPQETFKGNIVKSGKKICLEGVDFFPLRRQFLSYRRLKSFKADVKNILVILGGLPSIENILSLAKVLDGFLDKKINLHIILGYTSRKVKRFSFSPRIKFYQKIDNLAYLISQVDLGIVSGGFIKFEFMCVGTPFALVSLNNHQELLSKKFASKGYGVYLGRLDDLIENDRKFNSKIDNIFSSVDLRRNIFQRSRRLVDGNGSNRILKIARDLVKKRSV